MQDINEREIRETVARIDTQLDKLSRNWMYEVHRMQRKLNIIIITSFALIAIAFLFGVSL